MPSKLDQKKNRVCEAIAAARCRGVMSFVRYDKRQVLTQETASSKATPMVKVNTPPDTEESGWHTSWSEYKDCHEELSTEFSNSMRATST